MTSSTPATQNDKKALLSLKRQMLNLSQFVTKLTNFYQGVSPVLDGELNKLRSILSSPATFSAAEASIAKLAGLLIDDSDAIKNQNRHSVNLLKVAIKNLQGQQNVPEALQNEHFKQINDTYGHAAGDKTLQVIAQTMNKVIRTTDFLARWGGEEFVILFPDTYREGLSAIVEKIRHKIEAIPFKFKDAKVVITISIGATDFNADDSTETVFERADKYLYQAKNSGRNRSVLG